VMLKVGNRAGVVALATRTASVFLLSGHVLILYGCLLHLKVESIPQLIQHGYTFSFACNECHILYNNMRVGKDKMVNNLYFLETHVCEYS